MGINNDLGEGDAPLDPRLEAMIGAKLRNHYDALTHEPVPDRIIDLLRQLDMAEQSGEGTPDTDKKQE